MNIKHDIYLISDSTGETLDRIFLALKAQFSNFEYNNHQYSFTRTENQILKIIELAKKQKDTIILYTIVDDKLAKYLEEKAKKNNIPCFSVLGDLILNFSKLLKQRASHIPSGQHTLEENSKRIEAIQFTMKINQTLFCLELVEQEKHLHQYISQTEDIKHPIFRSLTKIQYPHFSEKNQNLNV